MSYPILWFDIIKFIFTDMSTNIKSRVLIRERFTTLSVALEANDPTALFPKPVTSICTLAMPCKDVLVFHWQFSLTVSPYTFSAFRLARKYVGEVRIHWLRPTSAN